MKRGCFLMFLCFFSMFGFSQYQKGDVIFAIGSGVGVYTIKSTETPNSLSSRKQAAISFNSSFNYSLNNKLAIGVDFERNHFLAYRFSNDFYIGYGISYNYRMGFLYRLINSDRTSLSIEIGFGGSSFKFGERITKTYFRSNGLIFNAGARYQYSIWNNVGMFANVNFVNHSYSKIINENEVIWKLDNSLVPIRLTLPGISTRIGLQYKF